MKAPVELTVQDLFLISRKGRYESVRSIAMEMFLTHMDSGQSRKSLDQLSAIYTRKGQKNGGQQPLAA